jgi:hypothetical protein
VALLQRFPLSPELLFERRYALLRGGSLHVHAALLLEFAASIGELANVLVSEPELVV